MGKDKKITIDCWTFLNMLNYNDNFQKYNSKSKLDNLIRLHEEIRDITIKQIEKIINPMIENIKEFDDASFEMKIKPCLNILNRDIKNISDRITGYENTLKKENIPEKKKEILQGFKKKQQEDLEKLKATKNKLKSLIQKYNDMTQQLAVSDLYKMIANKEVKVFITPSVLEEIRTDTRHSSKMKKELLNRCYSVTLSNKAEFDKKAKRLSELLRGHYPYNFVDREHPVAMEDAVNKSGEYTDSLFMAESNLLGLVLVTQNKKDFIYKKCDIKNNEIAGETRRKIMESLFNKIEGCSDALPYSPQEFVQGKYKEPTIVTNFNKELKKENLRNIIGFEEKFKK